MGFFRDPEYRSREFGIGIFYFGLDRKISKSRGSGFENPEKTRKKNPEIPKISGIGIGILKPLKNTKKIPSAKSWNHSSSVSFQSNIYFCLTLLKAVRKGRYDRSKEGGRPVTSFNCYFCPLLDTTCRRANHCFPNKETLIRHNALHLQINKFMCGYCEHKHFRQDTIKQHIRLKHPERAHELKIIRLQEWP